MLSRLIRYRSRRNPFHFLVVHRTFVYPPRYNKACIYIETRLVETESARLLASLFAMYRRRCAEWTIFYDPVISICATGGGNESYCQEYLSDSILYMCSKNSVFQIACLISLHLFWQKLFADKFKVNFPLRSLLDFDWGICRKHTDVRKKWFLFDVHSFRLHVYETYIVSWTVYSFR